MHERRNESSDNQRDANGDADTERHSEMAHGEAVAYVADSPHRAEKGNAYEERSAHGCVEAMKVRQEEEAHSDRKQNPGEQSRKRPGGLP